MMRLAWHWQLLKWANVSIVAKIIITRFLLNINWLWITESNSRGFFAIGLVNASVFQLITQIRRIGCIILNAILNYGHRLENIRLPLRWNILTIILNSNLTGRSDRLCTELSIAVYSWRNRRIFGIELGKVRGKHDWVIGLRYW